MGFTYVRTWAGFVHVAFIVDSFAQMIVAWNAATTKEADLVMVPLRMAVWQRARDGRPIVPRTLIGHADARVSIRVEHVHSGRLRTTPGRPNVVSRPSGCQAR